MATMRWIVCGVAVALLACGGGTTRPRPEPVAPDSARPALTLGELRIYYQSEVLGALHGDGSVVTKKVDGGWSRIGQLTPDARWIANDGKVIAGLRADGVFAPDDGSAPWFRVVGDVAMFDADDMTTEITIDPHGNVQGKHIPDEIRIEGATDPGMRRAALLAFTLLVIRTPARGPEVPASAP
jgi:hypothetical protein